jgi:hypothetical protein
MAIKIKNKNKKIPVSPETTYFFLSGVLQKAENFARHMDNQTSILVGLSSGLFILSVSQIKAENMAFFVPLLFLAIFSLFAALVAMFALIPPKFMRKRGQKESLLYNKKIAGCFSEQYRKELKDVSLDLNKIIDEYSLEIYNICRYYYRPKRRLFKLSRILLCSGIFISLFVLSLQILSSFF